MVAFLIIAVIVIAAIIIAVKTHSAYEEKVGEVKNSFLSEVSNFAPLVNLCLKA